MFRERIERWQHGPVVRSLYHAFKEYERESIPFPDSVQVSDYPEIALEMIDRVYETYGPFEPWALRNMTHREPPWRDTEAEQGDQQVPDAGVLQDTTVAARHGHAPLPPGRLAGFRTRGHDQAGL